MRGREEEKLMTAQIVIDISENPNGRYDITVNGSMLFCNLESIDCETLPLGTIMESMMTNIQYVKRD